MLVCVKRKVSLPIFWWQEQCLYRNHSKVMCFQRGYSSINTLSGFQYLLCIDSQRLFVSRSYGATSSNKKRSPTSLKRSDTTLKILRARFAPGYCTANVIKELSSLWGRFIHRAQDSDMFLISIMFFTWWPMALCVTSSCKSLLIRQMEQPPCPLPSLPSFSLFLTQTHAQTHSCKFNVHTCTQWAQQLCLVQPIPISPLILLIVITNSDTFWQNVMACTDEGLGVYLKLHVIFSQGGKWLGFPY